MANVERRRPPIGGDIVGIHHHLRLIVGLRPGQAGIQILIFRPGVIGADFQTSIEPMDHVGFERVVSAVAFGIPEESRAQTGIGARGHGNILPPLHHTSFSGPRGATGNTGGSLANLRRDGIRIDAHQTVDAEGSHIGYAQRGVFRDLVLQGEIPFLDREGFGIGLQSLRRQRAHRRRSGTARRRRGLDDWQQRQQCLIREGKTAVGGRQRVHQKIEGVDHRIINAVAGSQRGLAVAEDVPRKRDARGEQFLHVVLRQNGTPDNRVGQQNSVAIGDVIGGAARLLIPAGSKFLADAQLRR